MFPDRPEPTNAHTHIEGRENIPNTYEKARNGEKGRDRPCAHDRMQLFVARMVSQKRAA